MTVLWWVWLGRLPSCMGKCGEMCYKLLVSDDLSRQRCLSVRTLLTLLVLSFSAAGTWIIGCKSVLKRASNKVRPDCACILVPELLCLLFCFRLHLQALSLCNWTPFLRNVVMWDTLLCDVCWGKRRLEHSSVRFCCFVLASSSFPWIHHTCWLLKVYEPRLLKYELPFRARDVAM